MGKVLSVRTENDHTASNRGEVSSAQAVPDHPVNRKSTAPQKTSESKMKDRNLHLKTADFDSMNTTQEVLTGERDIIKDYQKFSTKQRVGTIDQGTHMEIDGRGTATVILPSLEGEKPLGISQSALYSTKVKGTNVSLDGITEELCKLNDKTKRTYLATGE